MARKELEDLLQGTGFDALFYGHPDAVFAFDLEGRFLDCNEAVAVQVGYTRDELLAMTFLPTVHESDLERVQAEFQAAAQGETRRYRCLGIRRDGSTFRSDVLNIPLMRDGRPVAVLGIARDIEDLESAAAESQRNQSLLRMAGQLASFGGWTYSVPGHIQTWSEEVFDIFRLPRGTPPPIEEVLAMYEPESLAAIADSLDRCERDGTPFSVLAVIRDFDGERRFVRSVGEAVRDGAGAVTGIQGAFYDVTAQELERQSRRKVEEQLATTLGIINEAILVIDFDWTVRYLNPSAEAMMHRSADEVLGQELWAAVPGLTGSEFGIALRRAMTDRATTDVKDYVASFDLWIEGSAYPTDEGIAVYLRDVSPQERSRRELVAHQKRLSSQAALLDITHDPILVRSLDGTIHYWNRAASELYGWTAEEAVGRRVQDLIYSDDLHYTTAVAQVLLEGSWSGEIEQVSRSGRRMTMDVQWQLIRDDEGMPEAIFAVNVDVTEKKRQEGLALRAQRMESLGTLAGGIAHDLNNVLTPILMSVQLLSSGERDEVRKRILDTMETSVKRGADMIRQVLSFARGVEGERVPVDLAQLLDEVKLLGAESLPKDIEVDFSVHDGLWRTLGDPTQLLQVLMNLVTNARDAMPEGGHLRLSAENVELADTYSSVSHLATPGRYVFIQVEDTGAGIDAEVIGKIFEPFFTTKEVGKGTGLGLATSVAIVRSHGGFMQVYSDPGRGSKFQLHLPALADTDVGTAVDPEIELLEQLPRGNGELVLIVDDEASIRQITRQALEAYGYRTTVASNGLEAIEVVESSTEPIDLVLTDMMMPVMDGAAVAAHLSRSNPEIRVLAASGLNANGGVARAASHGVHHFIAKPYTTAQLLHAVRNALANERAVRHE